MANKKFYYHNKNKQAKPQSAQETVPLYPAEKLMLKTAELGISEATCALLENNGIVCAADLVKRTEKDMYRVQGFGKKMLLEIKDALKKADMSLREGEKPSRQPQNAQGGKQQTEKAPHEDVGGSRFGLADRKADSNQKQKQPQPQKQNPQKQAQQPRQEKLAAPLPVEQWRKVMKGGKWGYSDGFKIVVPTMYDEVFCFKEGLASVELDGKCGYIDSENNVVIPFEYDVAMSFSEGYAMVILGDKCGYINKNNEQVIPCQYDAATAFELGEAKVKKDGKWGTLTTDGKITWI